MLVPDVRQTGCNWRSLHKVHDSLPLRFKPVSYSSPPHDCVGALVLPPPPSYSSSIRPFLVPLPPQNITHVSTILLFSFNGFNSSPFEVGTVCVWVHLEGSWAAGGGGGVLGGLSASPDSCCKIERSGWDQAGGAQSPPPTVTQY